MAEKIRSVNAHFTESEFARLEAEKKRGEFKNWPEFILAKCLCKEDDLK